MRKGILAILALSATILAFSSCKKDDSSLDLSQSKVEFTSSSGKVVITSASGFILDDIRVDGKDVSLRTQTQSGELQVYSDWLTIVTPGASSGKLVNAMTLTVKPNDTSSKRECKVLVHNSATSKTITVTQTCLNDEKSDK